MRMRGQSWCWLRAARLPFVLKLADEGVEPAMKSDPHLMHGLNVYHGRITNAQVGTAHGLDYVPAEQLLAA